MPALSASVPGLLGLAAALGLPVFAVPDSGLGSVVCRAVVLFWCGGVVAGEPWHRDFDMAVSGGRVLRTAMICLMAGCAGSLVASCLCVGGMLCLSRCDGAGCFVGRSASVLSMAPWRTACPVHGRGRRALAFGPMATGPVSRFRWLRRGVMGRAPRGVRFYGGRSRASASPGNDLATGGVDS